mgnify:CR=1 FL=1
MEVEVLWRPWWREPLAEQQPRRREAVWEGSCRQSPAPRDTDCIRCEHVMGERAMRLEALCHPDRVSVYAAGMWGEGHAPYLGRPVRRSLTGHAERARSSACNGRGPWCNAGASYMNQAVPNLALQRMGLVSLLSEYRIAFVPPGVALHRPQDLDSLLHRRVR